LRTTLTASSETKRKTLEEIAAAFGDRVILPDDREEDVSKPDLQHNELADAGVKVVRND